MSRGRLRGGLASRIGHILRKFPLKRGQQGAGNETFGFCVGCCGIGLRGGDAGERRFCRELCQEAPPVRGLVEVSERPRDCYWLSVEALGGRPRIIDGRVICAARIDAGVREARGRSRKCEAQFARVLPAWALNRRRKIGASPLSAGFLFDAAPTASGGRIASCFLAAAGCAADGSGATGAASATAGSLAAGGRTIAGGLSIVAVTLGGADGALA